MSDKKLDNFLNNYKKDIQKIVQVGAHFGQEIPIFEKYNINEVFLFEPNEVAVSTLRRKIENISPKTSIKIYPFALGSENKMSEMYYSEENEGQSSSILEPQLHKVVQPRIKFNKKVSVTVRRFEDLEIDNTDFLIMDVQGFELEVLKGFGRKLESLQFIFTEVNRDALYKDNVLIGDLDTFLKLNNFIRVWTSWRTADMPWGDAFYIKEKKLSKTKILYLTFKNLIFTNNLFFLLYSFFDFRLYKKRLKKILRKT